MSGERQPRLLSTRRSNLIRVAPLALLALVLLAAFAFRFDRYLSFDALLSQRIALDAFVANNFILAFSVYVAVSAILIGVSMPISFFLCVVAGYLFGVWTGTFAGWLSCVTGAGILFLAGRTALRDLLGRLAGPWLARFENYFNKNAFHYLLTLRLIPAFPFAAVNVVAPFFDIKLRDYLLATAIGIVPITLVFTSIGAALRAALNAGATLDPAAALQRLMFSPPVLAMFAGLIAVMVATLVFRARGRGGASKPRVDAEQAVNSKSQE